MPNTDQAHAVKIVRETIKSEHFLAAALESGEAFVDQLIDNPVAKEMPGVGIVLKLIKATGDARDLIFAAKLKRFFETVEADDSVRDEWHKRITESSKECERVVELLILVIEQTNDLKKSELFAILFLAFVHREIDDSELSRLVQAVDMCFSDDVLKFVSVEAVPMQSTELWMEYIQHANFTESGNKTFDQLAGTPVFDTALLGKLLRRAYKAGEEKIHRRL
ncbi:MAG: hypothetical protein AAF171_19340 [Cyanobacteria bacterium P01_A01_bin.116]